MRRGNTISRCRSSDSRTGNDRRRADAAGIYRYSWPKKWGGQEGSNLGMAIIREHLAGKGLGLHCDLQNEHTIVGNALGIMLMDKYGIFVAASGFNDFSCRVSTHIYTLPSDVERFLTGLRDISDNATKYMTSTAAPARDDFDAAYYLG